MKKILITGAGGFIGSHLTEYCVQKGYDVRAFIHYNSNNFRGWLEHSPYVDDIDFVAGDIRDIDIVKHAIKGRDSVLHLAALIGIPYSYLSPLAYIQTNVIGTNNVLDVGRDEKLENIVITSTSETYGTAQYVPIDEKHPANAQSPYAASKVAADQLALTYYRSFDVPVKIARPFNTFGPRQSARAIIPTIVTQLLSGKKEIKLGNTNPTRDFTYVEDTVRGILEIANSDQLIGETTNIGTNAEISIADLAEKLIQATGHLASIVGDDKRLRPEKSEVERLVCNNEKLVKATGWKPEISFEKGCELTIHFIKDQLNLYKSETYNV